MRIRTQLTEDQFFDTHPMCLCLNGPGPQHPQPQFKFATWSARVDVLSHIHQLITLAQLPRLIPKSLFRCTTGKEVIVSGGDPRQVSRRQTPTLPHLHWNPHPSELEPVLPAYEGGQLTAHHHHLQHGFHFGSNPHTHPKYFLLSIQPRVCAWNLTSPLLRWPYVLGCAGQSGFCWLRQHPIWLVPTFMLKSVLFGQ